MGYERKISRNDMMNCVLCEDAPCAGACGRIACDRALRSVWFDNEEGAARKLPKVLPCEECDAPCEKACIRQGKVAIKELMKKLHELPEEERTDGEAVQSKGIMGLSLVLKILNSFLTMHWQKTWKFLQG